MLGRPLVLGFGWAGAVLVPVAPLVHSLRLFGRVGRSADRDWLLFLGGLVLLAPVLAALALGIGREESGIAGLWGGLVAFYAVEGFGTFPVRAFAELPAGDTA